MRQYCVVSLFGNVPQAHVALKVLGSAHFGDDDVTFVTHSESPEFKEFQAASRKPTPTDDRNIVKNAEDESAGSRTISGAVTGAAVATPIAIGTAVFPLFIAGPLLAGVLGALLGALADEEKDPEAGGRSGRALEERIRGGAALIVVTGDELRVDDA